MSPVSSIISCWLTTGIVSYNSRICVKKVHRGIEPTTHSVNSSWAYQPARLPGLPKTGACWLPRRRGDRPLTSALLALGILCMRAQLCLTLCNPMGCSPPGSSVLRFSRQESWSGLPFPPPGDLPDPEIEPMSPMSPAFTGSFCTTEPSRGPKLDQWQISRISYLRYCCLIVIYSWETTRKKLFFFRDGKPGAILW